MDQPVTKSVKLLINSSGHAELTHPSAPRGYAGNRPIVEIVDVPYDVPSATVQREFSRVAIVKPMMFCDLPVPYDKIRGAEQGRIVMLDN